MGWVGWAEFSRFLLVYVGLGRVVLMLIFKVVIILQHKKCILLLYSPVAALILTFLCDLTNIRDQLLFCEIAKVAKFTK